MANIETFGQETRIFPAPAEFSKTAAISGMDAYRALVAEAEQDYEGFWGRLARENLQWHKPFTKVLDESNAPFYKWFDDGKLNVSYNCLDVHLQNGNADKVAVMYGGRLAELADSGAVLARPAHPYTVGLLESRLTMRSDREHQLPTLPGEPPDPRDLPNGCAFAPRCAHLFARDG